MQSLRPLLLLLALLAIPHLLPASTLTSYSFIPSPQGANPESTLLLGSDGNYYGTTYSGGTSNQGTVFKVTLGGTLTTLVAFNGTNGANPYAGLIQANDGNFYGTTYGGGSSNAGTVFKITPSGNLTTIVNFNGFTSGASPKAELIQASDGNFYGTTVSGGFYGYGTVFELTPAGALTTLVNFPGHGGGSFPYAGLIQASDGDLYGTTDVGGIYSDGTIFKLTPNGTGYSFSIIFNFNGTNGSHLFAGLVQGSDGNFYGTTEQGGTSGGPGAGTVFKLSPNGAGYSLTTLVNFNGTNGAYPFYGGLIQGTDGNFYGTTTGGTVFQITPSGALTTLVTFNGNNGSGPFAGLIRGSDGNFYGTTYYGGASGLGTIFKVSMTGLLTTVVNFTSNGTPGANPSAGLIQASDGNFYGTTYYGGTAGEGTVFQFKPNGTLTTMASFNSSNGANPTAGIIQGRDGNFYGTTEYGGSSSEGTVFQLTPGGTLTTLVTFQGTNGYDPTAGLIQGIDGNFYGTTLLGGGTNSDGNVFKLTPNGSGFTFSTLVNFNNTNGSYPQSRLIQGSDGNFYGTTEFGGSTGTGSYFTGDGTAYQLTLSGTVNTLINFNSTNGSISSAGLVQGSDGNFYGTTQFGGSSSNGTQYSGTGTVFQLTPGGTLTTLANFTGLNGLYPYAGLIQGGDGNFYGTTEAGGSSSEGTVYQVTPTGNLTTLVNFNSTNGANPYAGLCQSTDGNFYGTTQNGGTANAGTVFRLDLTSSETVSFTSASTIPIVSSGYTITGSALNLTLNYAPSPGDILTVIQNIGGSPINGTFTNLPNGGTILATYNGATYTFTANYFGGTDGQDLTLTLTSCSADTPLLPTWAWLLLLTGLFLASARRLRPA